MEALFTLNGTVEHEPKIDEWFTAHPEILRAMAKDWFTIMRDSGSDVREILHDGFPTACIGDVPFAHVATFSKHVNVAFFRGADLDDPQGLLEGKGRFMRHVKVKPGQPTNEQALTDLIHRAYSDMQERISLQPSFDHRSKTCSVF